MPAKTRKAAKKRAPHGTVNGRVLTVKNLSESSYMVIHTLPRGTRESTMKALLKMAVAARKKLGADWHLKAVEGKLRIA